MPPEALLEEHAFAVDAKARPVERRLRVEAVVDERGHELEVRLGLDEPAHHTERARAARRPRRSMPGMIVW